jgi:hypothetical protein
MKFITLNILFFLFVSSTVCSSDFGKKKFLDQEFLISVGPRSGYDFELSAINNSFLIGFFYKQNFEIGIQIGANYGRMPLLNSKEVLFQDENYSANSLGANFKFNFFPKLTTPYVEIDINILDVQSVEGDFGVQFSQPFFQKYLGENYWAVSSHISFGIQREILTSRLICEFKYSVGIQNIKRLLIGSYYFEYLEEDNPNYIVDGSNKILNMDISRVDKRIGAEKFISIGFRYNFVK